MAEMAYFFDAVLVDGVYDRAYASKDFANFFADLVKSGVLLTSSTNLQVIASSGMTVLLNPGVAFLKGQRYYNDVAKPINVPTADGSLDRIDRIVVRLNYPERKISTELIAGIPSSNPQSPSLTRTEDVYDLCLAEIKVSRGSTAITQANITDTRLDTNICGVVTGLIEQIDTSTMYAQLTEQFNVWFNGLKSQLSEDVAGNLLVQIEELKEFVGKQGVTSGTAPEYTFTLAGYTPVAGDQLKLKIHAAATSGATLNVNGLGAKPIVDSYGNQVQELAANTWIILVYDGTNFQAPGLSNQYAKYA